jgi:rhamnosyltransferase
MIGAIVVFYNPNVEQVNQLLGILDEEVSRIVIVDNSETSLENEFTSNKIKYIHFPENIGIASAHNQGIMYLKLCKEISHVVIFDQDSSIQAGLIGALYRAMENIEHQQVPIAAVGPQIICSFSNKAIMPKIQKNISQFFDISIVSQIIASGMMIKLSVVDYVGLKEDKLFIDGVDHEWCWRAKQNGFVVGVARNIKMIHTLGDKRSNFLGLTYKVSTPIRLYYQFRNLIILSKRSYVPSYWKLRHLSFMPLKFFLMSCFQDNKLLRLKFMLKGIYHGIFSQAGKYK